MKRVSLYYKVESFAFIVPIHNQQVSWITSDANRALRFNHALMTELAVSLSLERNNLTLLRFIEVDDDLNHLQASSAHFDQFFVLDVGNDIKQLNQQWRSYASKGCVSMRCCIS